MVEDTNFKKDDNKIYLEDTEGRIIAEVEFEETEKGTFNIYHTYVDESLRGQGVASKLIQKAVNEIRAKNGKVTASCSYAKKWLEKNEI